MASPEPPAVPSASHNADLHRRSAPRRGFLGIQRKIFLVFGLFFTMLVGGGGWAVAHYFTAADRSRLEQRQYDEVSLLARGMDDKFGTYLNGLTAVAASLPERALRDRKAALTWLRDHKGIRSMFSNGTLLLDPEGRILAEDTEAAFGHRVPAHLQAFFRSVVNQRKAAISEAYVSEATGAPAVLMAAPRLDGAGRVLAVLGGSVDLARDDFLGAISGYRSRASGLLQLFDSRRRALIHPDPAQLLEPVGSAGSRDLLDAAIAGFEGSGTWTGPSGTRTISSVARLRSINAILASSLPVPEALRPMERFRSYLKVAVALTVGMSLFLTWLISHRLVDRLQDVTGQIRSLADLPAGSRTLRCEGRDEATLLARSFNEMIGRLESRERALAKAKVASDEELAITKHTLQRLTAPGLLALPPRFHMETLQTRRINGDACTYQQGFPGVHFGFICDATGHGLAAGVSTIPAIQTFLHMTKRNIPLETIYRKINERLRQMLPPGRFVCLMLIRLDVHDGSLSILNAGLPDALFWPRQGPPKRFPSRNLPAGVVDAPDHLPAGVVDAPDHLVTEQVAAREGDGLFAFTDGLQEVLGDRLPSCLAAWADQPFEARREAIRETLEQGNLDREQVDDVSWALWEVPPPDPGQVSSKASRPRLHAAGPLHTSFSVSLAVEPQRHGMGDLLPDGLRLLGNQGVPREALQTLGLALSEALSNAVDHGLLGLDSGLKQHGFEEYLEARRKRLTTLKEGLVLVEIKLRSDTDRRVCEIAVSVVDSGPGFDWRAWQDRADQENSELSGRGLQILRAVSAEMGFNEAGNAIHFTLACH